MGIPDVTNPLHVLQATGVMRRGGAEIMLMDILRHLSADVRCDFLIHAKKDNPQPQGDFDEEIRRLGARLRYIGTQWELGIPRYVARFREIIREIGKPDVVHIHLNAKDGVIALAARSCGIRKVIAHSHGERLVPRGPCLRALPHVLELRLQRLLINRFATDYWGCSEKACESLFGRRFLHRHPWVVINNAIDFDAFESVSAGTRARIRSSYGADQNTLVIGNTGRVIRRKELGFVIEVLRALDARGIEFLFVCAGRVDDMAYMDEVMSKVTANRLQDRVLPLGDRGDMPAVLSGFDVFVSPARDEAFGMVAAEAQAAGVPCVLSTGFPPSVDMGLGLVTFVDAYNPTRWAEAILACRTRRCSDKELIRQRIAERGFDVVENTQRIEQLYRS